MRALLFTVLVFFHGAAAAVACTSAGTGNWNVPATWSGCAGGNGTPANTPGTNDTVTILGGNNVTVNIANAAAISVQLGGTTGGSGNGTLTFNAGSRLAVSGTLTFGNGARTGTVNMTAGGTLAVGAFAYTGGTWTPGTGTVETTANNTLPNNTNIDTFNNFTVVSGTTTLSRGTAVNGALTVTGTWNGANQAVTLNGNFTNNGTFTSGTGTYTFSGGALQTITGTSGGTTFAQLNLNNGNNLQLSGTHDLTISTLLTLTNGVLITNANTVYISNGSNIASAGGNDFVQGNLRKPFAAGANVAETFEVGTGTTYCPVTVTFASVTVAGDITVSCAAGSHPQLASSGLDTAAKLNRWWTIANSASSPVSFTTYTAAFSYVAGDIDGGANAAAFVAARYDGAAWNATTLSAVPSTTLLTITGEAGFGDFAAGEGSAYNVLAGSGGRFNAYDPPPVTPAGAVNGYLRTKVAGTAFTLTIAHLNAGGTALANLAANVTIELVDASPGGGVVANNCRSTWSTIVATSGSVAFGGGSTMTQNFTVATAYPDVRVRVTRAGGAEIGCSGDRFAIRPAAFTIGSSASNNATTGTPAIKAGANFTITASHAGYTGTPGLGASPAQGTPVAGTLAGSFAAAAGGTATGTFTYDEVGNLGLNANAVNDATFTAVDQPNDCVVGSFSNTASNGRYGCAIGHAAIAPVAGVSGFGRFIPDRYSVSAAGTLTNRSALSCAPASSFTYMGEALSVAFTLEARNAGGTVTQNYAGAYVKLGTALAGNELGFAARGNTTDLSSRTLLTASAGTFTAGAAPVTASLRLLRAASPDGPLTPTRIGIAPSDSDGVTALAGEMNVDVDGVGGNDHVQVGGTTELRFGRLRVLNAIGSEKLDLPIPLRAEYWIGTGFATNTADDCTTLTQKNFVLSNPQGGVVMAPTPSPNMVTPTAGSDGNVGAIAAFSAGVSTVTLLKPSPAPASPGTVDLCVDLDVVAPGNDATCQAVTPANKTWLQLLRTNPPNTYTQDPVGRGAFGLYSTQPNNFIFFRENY